MNGYVLSTQTKYEQTDEMECQRLCFALNKQTNKQTKPTPPPPPNQPTNQPNRQATPLQHTDEKDGCPPSAPSPGWGGRVSWARRASSASNNNNNNNNNNNSNSKSWARRASSGRAPKNRRAPRSAFENPIRKVATSLVAAVPFLPR